MLQFQTQFPVDTIVLCAACATLALIPIRLVSMFSDYSAQKDDAMERLSKTVDATASLLQENAAPVPEVDKLLVQSEASLQAEAHNLFMRVTGEADVGLAVDTVVNKYKEKTVDVIDKLITEVYGNTSLQGQGKEAHGTFETKMHETVWELVSSLRDGVIDKFLIQVNSSIAEEVEQSTRSLHGALANNIRDLEQAKAHYSFIDANLEQSMKQMHDILVENVEQLMIRMHDTIAGDVKQLMTELQPPIISGAVAGLFWIFTAVYIYRRYSL